MFKYKSSCTRLFLKRLAERVCENVLLPIPAKVKGMKLAHTLQRLCTENLKQIFPEMKLCRIILNS
jgi:hypothetical protein